MKKLESVAQTCNIFSFQIIRGVSSESVAEVKVRLYYERFPLFRARKKEKNNNEEKQHQ